MIDQRLLTNIIEAKQTINNDLINNQDLLEKAQAKLWELMIKVRMAKMMQAFGERDSDIYIVTFAKSGTTLMQMMLYQMTTDGNMDFGHIYDVSPWARYSAVANVEMKSVGERRIIKTHDNYETLRHIRKGKFIVVIRDCPDAIISLHEHIKSYDNPNIEINNLVERKMDEWFRFNSEWLENESKLDILYLHYEDIIADKENIIKKIAAFCNIPLNEEILQRTIERSSLSYMKKHETKFGEQPDHWKVFNNFIRKGKAGEGRSLLTQDQRSKYNGLIKDIAFLSRYATQS